MLSLIPGAEAVNVLAVPGGIAASLSGIMLIKGIVGVLLAAKGKALVDHTFEGAMDVISVITSCIERIFYYIEDSFIACYQMLGMCFGVGLGVYLIIIFKHGACKLC